ncbi:MAG: alpha/beta hydrolase [Deltaproteobacteria bacterium]|nr:alpha/beta hydrolase [Deltaproteobacteria bacterium]
MKKRNPYCEMDFEGLKYELFGVPSNDGTSIAVQRCGDIHNPPLIIGNGIGVRYYGLHDLVKLLAKNFCVYLWDYRGIGDSTEVINEDFSIENHAMDALNIMDWFGHESYYAAGWSMGVGVMLEMYRKNPFSIRKMAALFGSPGKPFRKNFLFEKGFSGLLGFGSSHPWITWLVKKPLKMKKSALVRFLKKIGFASDRSDPYLFNLCVEGVLNTDSHVYAETLIGLGEHDGREVLQKISVPFYAAIGGKDWVTPAQSVKDAYNTVKNSQISFYPDASHFGIMEDHIRLNKELTSFFL